MTYKTNDQFIGLHDQQTLKPNFLTRLLSPLFIGVQFMQTVNYLHNTGRKIEIGEVDGNFWLILPLPCGFLLYLVEAFYCTSCQ